MINNDTKFRDIKKDFFSLRNGVIAEALKKLYPGKTIIFGLNVPQFMELRKKYPSDLDLGLKLWHDKGCRESRLFSLYIIPFDEIDMPTAIQMVLDVQSSEEAEFLAFRILRHLSFAQELFIKLDSVEKSSLSDYCRIMLGKNLQQISFDL